MSEHEETATDPTRDELVKLCEDAVAPMDQWWDRDSAAAHLQLGQAWSLLKAGCPFRIIRAGHMRSTDSTWWVLIEWKGFQAFEWGLDVGVSFDDDTFYIPTRKRVEEADGGDWY